MTTTVIQSGSFTSTGVVKDLEIRSDLDWIEVDNFTQQGTQQTPGRGVYFKWYRGMDNGSAIEHTKADGVDTLQGETITTNGFTLLDTSDQTPEALISTITDITAATPPVITNTGVNGLAAGDVVRIINLAGALQLGGMDFTVGNDTISDVTFSLDYMTTIAASLATTGSWRKINFDPIYYPRKRLITNITQASSAVVTMSVTHGFTVGQAIRMNVPDDFGMSEMNELIGNITAMDTVNNTITIDINSSSFTAFSFPLTTELPFTQAQVIPVGQTANETFANTLDDATTNLSIIGMRLGAGIDGPAGSSGDTIFWKGGRSSLVQ